MITVYQKNEAGAFASFASLPEKIHGKTTWIDLYNPTPDEEKAVETQLDIEILTREEIWKNQVLNRFYSEDGVSYMTAAIINKVDSPHPQTSAVTFILGKHYLVTLRYILPTSFTNFTQRLVKTPQKFVSGNDILEGLLEEVITRVAYNSEIVVEELDRLSHDIFATEAMSAGKNSSQRMKDVVRRLGASADLNSKINESLHSINRLLCFFKLVAGSNENVQSGVTTLMTDVGALSQQTAFLSDKVTFQLDATLGMINVEQNMIVKIFSIVAVFFLPPTLLSSIYGMNFANMPELNWQLGYPMAIFFMVTCALVPYAYFRRKGWL